MIEKFYSKNGKMCRVTFELPAEVHAKTACLCGEFNAWNETSQPLRRRRNGSFTLTLSFNSGQQYRFCYLLDGERWENDWAADAYVPNEFGSENSVVQL